MWSRAGTGMLAASLGLNIVLMVGVVTQSREIERIKKAAAKIVDVANSVIEYNEILKEDLRMCRATNVRPSDVMKMFSRPMSDLAERIAAMPPEEYERFSQEAQ